LHNFRTGKTWPGIDELDIIINNENQKHTIFLGDDLQKLNPDYDEGFNRIYKMVKDKKFREYNFKNTIGVSPEVLENIKYILNVGSGGQVQTTYNFDFIVTNSNDEFYKLFTGDKTVKKHFVSIGLKPLVGEKIEISDKIIIREYPKVLRETEYPYLFNEEIKGEYFLTTYQVISREIESVYLFIPQSIMYDEAKEVFKFENEVYSYLNDFLLFHIYTLMTRATMKLTILCQNETVFSLLEKKN